MDEGHCTHVAAIPEAEGGLIVRWRCRCGKNVEQSTFSNGRPVAELAAERAAETLESVLGPYTEEELNGQRCVCGHFEREHAPQWCSALACECRVFRAAEAAS